MDMQQFITKKTFSSFIVIIITLPWLHYYYILHYGTCTIDKYPIFCVNSGMENFPLKGRCGEEHSLEQNFVTLKCICNNSNMQAQQVLIMGSIISMNAVLIDYHFSISLVSFNIPSFSFD